MNRRQFLKYSALGTAALALPSCVSLSRKTPKKPNIILIMADDLGYECLGCNGCLDYQTPHLDKLAETGIRFTNCYSQPLCTPSRVQIMTGQYNHRNYVGFGILPSTEITFANVLNRAGYTTAIAGKWQLKGDLDQPYRFGFDDYCLWQIQGRLQRYWNWRIIKNKKLLDVQKDKYGPDVFCDYIEDFVTTNRDKPFFLYFPMCLTHDPFCPTPDSDAPRNEKTRDTRFFGDMVNYMDKIIGRIVARLDSLGIRDNTLILFVGDNGTHPSITTNTVSGPVKGAKGAMTNAGTHVPFIANWPAGTSKTAVCDDLIDFSDFMPTLAELTGAPMPTDRVIDGRSFLPQLRGKKGDPREWIFCHYWGYGRKKEKTKEFMRDKRFKLYDDGTFYDLETDPLEKSPLEKLTKEAAAAKKRLQKAFENLREPLKIHFGEQANLFDSGRRQEKAALASAKADFPSLGGIQKSSTCRSKAIIRATLKK